MKKYKKEEEEKSRQSPQSDDTEAARATKSPVLGESPAKMTEILGGSKEHNDNGRSENRARKAGGEREEEVGRLAEEAGLEELRIRWERPEEEHLLEHIREDNRNRARDIAEGQASTQNVFVTFSLSEHSSRVSRTL
jgi:hypothetical protein